MRNWWWLVVLPFLLSACKSRPLGPYVSPRVTGRVLAADTGQPLEHVRVTRGKPDQAPMAGCTPKGGEILMRKPPALTGADGRFALPCERVLSLFRGSGWNQIHLSFVHPGYLGFHTNCPTLQATNTPAGQPLLDIGDVRLQPGRAQPETQ